jgi:hypothetical protein
MRRSTRYVPLKRLFFNPDGRFWQRLLHNAQHLEARTVPLPVFSAPVRTPYFSQALVLQQAIAARALIVPYLSRAAGV